MCAATGQDDRIAKLTIAQVYPLYLAKVRKKGRSEEELLQVIEWLTGYNKAKLRALISNKATLATFFQEATLHPDAHLIKGVICGYRIEHIENDLTRQVRYLDKLVDELAKGSMIQKILRASKCLLLYLLLSAGIPVVAQPGESREIAFEAAKALSWEMVFEDDCTDDWSKRWFMDGTQGRITHSEKGMDYFAGQQLENDSSHTVLWTRKKFSGDIRVEYDFTRLDTTPVGVNILYLLASGSGKGPYKKDLSRWSYLRRVPAMKSYFDHMHTYHISYAVNGKGNPEPDYIRARRYLPETGNGLEGTGLLPEYLNTGLFEPGKPYHICVIRNGSRLYMEVTDGSKSHLFFFNTRTHPDVKAGRIGLRQMWGHASRYAHFKVFTR